MFIYAVRIERDAMFVECIPVGKKTLLIFIISDDSADIIELCAAMFSDQMFHQRAGCMVVVNSGEVRSGTLSRREMTGTEALRARIMISSLSS